MKKMQMGQEVWFNTTWVDVNSGIVCREHEENADYVVIQGTRDTRGSWTVAKKNCYPSEQALMDALKSESDKNVAEICAKIKTVEDLVAYMYNHTVSCAEEYTNWDARKAVAIRAKELLGLELN